MRVARLRALGLHAYGSDAVCQVNGEMHGGAVGERESKSAQEAVTSARSVLKRKVNETCGTTKRRKPQSHLDLHVLGWEVMLAVLVNEYTAA